MSNPVGETEGKTVIFSRPGGGGGRHAAEDPRRSGRHSADSQDDQINGAFVDVDDADLNGADRNDADVNDGDLNNGYLAGGTDGDRVARPAVAPSGRHDAYTGPYDISEAPVGQVRVDLGSLQIPSIEGVEVRVQATEGVIQQVVLAHGASALQLGAFAAPRTEGIWDEVREEIRKSLFNDGVAAEEAAGEFGVELRARVRAADGMMDLRFIGIDGPRWMLRAVYQGDAAADPSAAGPLALCLRGLVVDRGREAMPVRDALPLRLPREMADQVNAQLQTQTQTQVEQDQVQQAPTPPAMSPPTADAQAFRQATSQPAGSQPAGSQPAGSQPAGSQLAGSQSATAQGTPPSATSPQAATRPVQQPANPPRGNVYGASSNTVAGGPGTALDGGGSFNGIAGGGSFTGGGFTGGGTFTGAGLDGSGTVTGNSLHASNNLHASNSPHASTTPHASDNTHAANSTHASGSDDEQRRRPSPRPRRSE